MKTPLRPVGIALLALVLPAAALARQGSPDGDLADVARVEPAVVVPRLMYEQGDRLVMQLQLRNPSRRPYELSPGCLNVESLRLERLADHTILKPSGRIEGVPRSGPLTIEPYATRSFDLDLNRLYKRLKEPGRYRLSWSCGERSSDHPDFVVALPYDPETDRVAIVTTDLGTMELVLMPEVAPKHVRNFVGLAKAGYYDGVAFYKIIPGVQAETGDPQGDGSGGWRQQLDPEIDPGIRAGKGLVAAVRRETTITSASQFFFLLDVQPTYAGKNTFFAYVRKGTEVLDALGEVPVSESRGVGAFRPLKLVRVQKIEIKKE